MIHNEDLLIVLILVLHSVLIAFLISFAVKKKSERKSRMVRPLIFYVVTFPILFCSLLIYLNPNTLIGFATLLVYCIIGAYAFCLEIPSYISISKFDDDTVKGLTEIRSTLIPLKYSFSSKYEIFKNTCDKNRKFLMESKLSSLVDDFEKFSNQIKNLNEKFWEILFLELNREIEYYNSRSKHPYPKLIEVLSLTGLSFLIAQILHVLG